MVDFFNFQKSIWFVCCGCFCEVLDFLINETIDYYIYLNKQLMKRSKYIPLAQNVNRIKKQEIQTLKIIQFIRNISNREDISILFDSDIVGDSNCSLINTIQNKEDLIFILFDQQDNVFGGYLHERITSPYTYVNDPKSVVFSIIRRGKLQIKKYTYEKSNNYAFFLYPENDFGYLFEFGFGLFLIQKTNSNMSWCNFELIKSENKAHPFVDVVYPQTFQIQRIVILEVC
ncbi:TLDc domain-containing protein [Entamoeba marina]